MLDKYSNERFIGKQFFYFCARKKAINGNSVFRFWFLNPLWERVDAVGCEL